MKKENKLEQFAENWNKGLSKSMDKEISKPAFKISNKEILAKLPNLIKII
jgi:hypothetical protein